MSELKQEVAVLQTQIAEYSPVAAAMAELRQKYSGVVFDVSTTAGMAVAKAARSELRGYRTSLEKKRVEIKAPALERARLIDSEAKAITAELAALEDPIDAVIKAEESRKERERAEKQAAEAARISDIHSRIAAIHTLPGSLIGRASEVVLDAVDGLLSNDVAAWSCEFLPVASEAKASALVALDDLYKSAVAREKFEAEEADRIAREREELARLRSEAEERERNEAARLAAERKEREEAEAASRARIEEEERAARARIEAEENRAREARRVEEDRQREERDRLAAAQRAIDERDAAARRSDEERQRAAQAHDTAILDGQELLVVWLERFSDLPEFSALAETIRAWVAENVASE